METTMNHDPRITTYGSTIEEFTPRGQPVTRTTTIRQSDMVDLLISLSTTYSYIDTLDDAPQRKEILDMLQEEIEFVDSVLKKSGMTVHTPHEALKPDPCDHDDDDDPDQRAWQEYLDGLIPGEREAAERFDINYRKAHGLPPRKTPAPRPCPNPWIHG